MKSSDAVEELAASLQRLRRLLHSRQVAARTAATAGVDVSQQGEVLLRVLLREGRQTVATLAYSAAMDLGAVSRQIRSLEESGAVRRTHSPNDGRVALLELTGKGRRIAERIRAVTVQHLEEAIDKWSEADRRMLATLIDRLVDDLVRTPLRPPASSSER